MTVTIVASAQRTKRVLERKRGCQHVVSAVLVVGMILTACTPAALSPSPKVDVRFGLIPGVVNAQVLVSADDGDFAARGLNVQVQPVNDPSQTMVAVASGQFELGGISVGAAAFDAFNRGADMKIIASIYADPPAPPGLFPLIVRSPLIDSGAVKTIADLKGRKFGLLGKANTGDYGLAKTLARAGLASNDVESVTLFSFQDIVAGLTTGAIDAAFVNQPAGAQVVAQGIGKVLADDLVPNAQIAVMIANTRFLETHRDAVVRFLEVYVRAIRRLTDGKLKHDQEALAVIQKYTNIPPEVIRQAPDPYWAKEARVDVESLRDQQAFFMANHDLDYTQPLVIESLIDYGPLGAALEKAGDS